MRSNLLVQEQPSESLLRFVLPLVGISAILLLGHFIGEWAGIDLLSREGVKAFRAKLIGFGIWMPVVFWGTYCLRAVMYVPEWGLMILAGVIAGPIGGLLLVISGAFFACSFAFGLGWGLKRLGGQSILHRIMKRNMRILEHFTDRMGFRTLLFLRMMPFFPFTVCCYGSSLAGMSYSRFISAILLGVLVPGTLYCIIGETAVHIFRTSSGWHVLVLLVLALMMIGVTGFYLLRHRIRADAPKPD